MKLKKQAITSNALQDIVVDLPPSEKKALRKTAQRYGVSVSDFVRSSLGHYFSTQPGIAFPSQKRTLSRGSE